MREKCPLIERNRLQTDWIWLHGDYEHNGVAIGYLAKSKKFNSVALGTKSETTRDTVYTFSEDIGTNNRTFITSELTKIVNGKGKALGAVSVKRPFTLSTNY